MKCRCGHDKRAHNDTYAWDEDGERIMAQCLHVRCRCPVYMEEERGIEVPNTYASCALEYRNGYEKGMKEDGAYNPISKRGPDGLKRRRAWEAGRQAGRKARERSGGIVTR